MQHQLGSVACQAIRFAASKLNDDALTDLNLLSCRPVQDGHVQAMAQDEASSDGYEEPDDAHAEPNNNGRAVLQVQDVQDDGQFADDDDNVPLMSDTDSDEDDEREEDSAYNNNNYAVERQTLEDNYNHIRDDFKEYECKGAGFLPFETKFVTAICLISKLRETKASLATYQTMMEWHMRATGDLKAHQKVTEHPDYVSPHVLYKTLQERYNRTHGFNYTTTIVLPFSRARAHVVWNDAYKVVQSLLTDPRIKDSDYLFHNPENPFEPPPANLNYLSELITGKSYIKTYQKLIKDPTKEILFPIELYIDGAATGQFANLPITCVKMSACIFHRKAREQPHMWRSLGQIPYTRRDASRGKRLLIDSGHVDATMHYHQTLRDEGLVAADKVCHAQDYHNMLAVVYKPLAELCESGFVWDFYYRGKLYKGVKFVPYIALIRCDTDEADGLCGSFKTRTGNVANLCRYCVCPTGESDNPRADYPLKTATKVNRLIAQGNIAALKAMSQHCLNNAHNALKFGQHSDQGVFGATPLEMLHALLLGMDKTVKECLLEQVGIDSALLDEFDALCREYGELLSRQSDRTLPKTKFNHGLKGKGKLMAKEFTGVLLILLCALKSEKMGNLLAKKRKKYFGDGKLQDWIMLLETLLEWEQWLLSNVMMKQHVYRAKEKHRYIMYLIKKIANRQKGMGLKTLKFHAIMHMVMDILHYGVPLEFDTGANESHHKPTKKAAMLTQKKQDTFDEQTAKRMFEMELLDLAKEELDGRELWCYHVGYDHPAEIVPQECPPSLGGEVLKVEHDPETNGNCIRRAKVIKGKKGVMIETDFIDFVAGLQDAVAPHFFDPTLPIYSAHVRGSKQIFRGTSSFLGRIWRDWALINWGNEEGILPAKIHGFIDLRALPAEAQVSYGGLAKVDPNIYAIVESAEYTGDDSDLLRGIETVVGEKDDEGFVTRLQYYLADVEAFEGTCAVIPDIGGNKNAYFEVQARSTWAEKFTDWLMQDYEEFSDEEEEESEENEEEEEENEEDDSDESASAASVVPPNGAKRRRTD